MSTLPIVDRWRQLALEFHAIEDMLGHLPCGFVPHDLVRLRRRVPMTGAVRAVIDFLLHVWNCYADSWIMPSIRACCVSNSYSI